MIDYRNEQYEHWPHYEDITDEYYRSGRFFYGEDRGGRLQIGRVVAFYRAFSGVITPAIEPVVRFFDQEGEEGLPEYVSLGTRTERYWMGQTVQDVEKAWREASSAGSWPQPHGRQWMHSAAPFYVDPAHYLLYYAALGDEGETYLGRVVGWDPPKFADELPTPIVRLYRPDGDLDGEGKYVGLDLPDNYWMTGTLESARKDLAEEITRRSAGPDLPDDPWTRGAEE
ncbi:hypothetical protein OEIGOIKO_00865 [Streptomyces chrestomyceticus JCM 4735]|uniref:Uncharacterized protein n=1 Tax=Streptomyces chrestomyceticus JCM 4735 TaxID=1306181 RepID=A0A7U9KPY2_9ACTN|nr:hypothetical protein [Streptomyces chrestomyceticus]GCD33146.1 hypothetical protein OEIGOIKO_00865 [Streptomyces chrestomyceticus JCM 4735]